MHENDILICIDADSERFLQIGQVTTIDKISDDLDECVQIRFQNGETEVYERNTMSGCFKKISTTYVN